MPLAIFQLGQGGAGGERQRAAHALLPGGQQGVKAISGLSRGQRRQIHPRIGANEHALHRMTAGAGRQLPHPGVDQLFSARLRFAIAQSRSAELHPDRALASCAQAVEPVVQPQVLVLDDQRPLVHRLRIGLRQLGPTAQQRQRLLLQTLRHSAAQRAQGQRPAALQLAHPARDGGLDALIHGGLRIVDQVAEQAVAVEPVEREDFVVVLRLQFVEHHVEPGAEKRLDRIFQEAGQLLQTQRFGERLERHRPISVPGPVLGHAAMRLPPLAGIGEQRGVALEVAAAEGLQGMNGGALREQIALSFALPTRGEIVAQLRHQHRRRLLGVVARAAASPAHIEHAARRQQRFEHEVAIVFAPGAISGPVLPGLMQQIEVAARAAARVVALVHAQQADDFEGNGAQRHQGAEGHPTGEKAPAARGLVQPAQPALAQHLQRHGFVEPRGGAMVEPGGERIVEAGAGFALAQVLRQADGVEQIARVLRPLARRGVLQGRAPPGLQHVEQIGQRADEGGIQPADFVKGHDVLKAVFARPGIAQQHAAQAEAPAVLLAAGAQAEMGAMVDVQPPAHARAGDPLRQPWPVFGPQAEAPGNGRYIEQGADVGGQNALLRQAQQPIQREQQRFGRPRRQVGDVEGNEARIPRRILAEHRPDGRGERGDIGRHHHDVARPQRSLAAGLRQQVQQLVVEDFDFALRAVADVKHHRTIRCGNGLARMFGQGQQIADGGLHLFEQRVAGRVVEQVVPRQAGPVCRVRLLVEGVELAHEIASLPPPGRQQRVSVGVHGLKTDLRQVARPQRPASRCCAQQLAALDDVGPVITAGIGQRDQHLHIPRQRHQRIEHHGRQMRSAKQHHPARQRGSGRVGCAFGGMQRLQHGALHLRTGGLTLRFAQLGQNPAPQPGLPALIFGQGRRAPERVDEHIAALCPGVEPVVAVDLILVVEVGQTLRQLQAAQQVLTLQILQQRRANVRIERAALKETLGRPKFP